MQRYYGGHYLKQLFDVSVMETILAFAAHRLQPVNFQLIVTTGLSGDLFGTHLAKRMDKRHVVVRKPGISSHSGSDITGYIAKGDKWLWVDDFVSSGNTRDRVIARMTEIDREQALGMCYIGSYLWTSNQYSEQLV